ncbi:hypothetical protein DFH06DRAFT_1136246 [Mycena polygramma]|nr:hypothetical protein DFH06DRAFT_1136246 [Mycena polygramma]
MYGVQGRVFQTAVETGLSDSAHRSEPEWGTGLSDTKHLVAVRVGNGSVRHRAPRIKRDGGNVHVSPELGQERRTGLLDTKHHAWSSSGEVTSARFITLGGTGSVGHRAPRMPILQETIANAFGVETRVETGLAPHIWNIPWKQLQLEDPRVLDSTREGIGFVRHSASSIEGSESEQNGSARFQHREGAGLLDTAHMYTEKEKEMKSQGSWLRGKGFMTGNERAHKWEGNGLVGHRAPFKQGRERPKFEKERDQNFERNGSSGHRTPLILRVNKNASSHLGK